MRWALEQPTRFLHEQAAIEALCAEVSWVVSYTWGHTAQFLLKLDADLAIGGEVFDVELTYPNLFPDTPAYVRPRSREARWSSHQFGAGGSLCLEWRPDNWHPEVTGADLLRSTYKLLATERGAAGPPAAVPSAHRLTPGQRLCASTRRLVVTAALERALENLPALSRGTLESYCLFHNSARVFLVTALTLSEAPRIALEDVPAGIHENFSLFSWRAAGWVFKSAGFDGARTYANAEDVYAAIRAAGFRDFVAPVAADGKTGNSEVLILLATPAGPPRALTIEDHGAGAVTEYAVLPAEASASTRLPPEHQVLCEKRIGIIGLGSVGSKAALSLARAGVRKFLLIDTDSLFPGNLVRHALDWGAIGLNKVNAVQEALALIAPGIDVQTRDERIAGQESPRFAAAALDALAACDLLIDATANPAVFVQLAAIARRKAKPLVWGELFAGGIGALLARSRPGCDPDPLSVRASINGYLETLPPAPFRAARTYDEDEQGEPLIAFDAEVGEFAATLTRVALDALLERNPSEFPHSAYLLGYKREWVFEAPFDTIPIQFPTQISAGDVAPSEDEAARAETLCVLAGLLK